MNPLDLCRINHNEASPVTRLSLNWHHSLSLGHVLCTYLSLGNLFYICSCLIYVILAARTGIGGDDHNCDIDY